ncbi:MAG TPA: transcriptional regulator, partial [Elusimicrobia bacterium]|nr:transcriptional regulator [Elusimicrobiota bacterium]
MSGFIPPESIDALIHERVRLGIMSALAATPELAFTQLRDMLKVTDGNLSVHA